jgi:hypothetical protein
MSKKTNSEKNKCWETNEIICLLELAIEKNLLKNMDSKTHRHSDLFHALTLDLNKRGYNRTMEQCKSKFRGLKSDYQNDKCKYNKSGAGGQVSQIHQLLKELFCNRPKAHCSEYGVDTSGKTLRVILRISLLYLTHYYRTFT